MRVTFARLLLDAWNVLRREHELVLAIAGVFVFLPTFAQLLIPAPLPQMPVGTLDIAALERWSDTVNAWAPANAGWYVLSFFMVPFGLATIAILLLDRERPSVGDAMRVALRRYPRFLLVYVVVTMATQIGLLLQILPGLLVQAMLIAALPALAANRTLGASGALSAGFAATKGMRFAIFAGMVTLFLVQVVIAIPVFSLDRWERVPTNLNPFVLALANALLAMLLSAYQVMVLLVGTIVWRRGAARQGI